MKTLNFKMIESMIRYWWLMSLAGILLIAVGIWVIKAPFGSYLSLSWVFAVGMIGTGVFEMFFSYINCGSAKRWGLNLIAGIVDLLVGGYLLYNPLITMLLLPLIVGLWVLFRGMTAIGDALHIRSHGVKEWKRLLFTAMTVIVLALLILACPMIGIENLIFLTGLAFIAAGFFRIILSLKLQKLKHDYKEFIA
ncbi:MAG: HdeD family acid-resistance protein [Mucilaginibacter sp.]